MHVWTVSAAQTCTSGLYCATSAESCAESATMAMPQTTTKISRTGKGALKSAPATVQHAALTIIAHAATRALPIRSAKKPAAADPIAPLAIVRKATADPRGELGVRPVPRPRLADANAAIHVHIA